MFFVLMIESGAATRSKSTRIIYFDMKLELALIHITAPPK